MEQIKWTTKWVDVKELTSYDKNPRDITKKSLELLEKSIKDYGQVVPLVVNQDFTIMGGNQRAKIINGKVWVTYPDRILSEKEVAEIVIGLNNKLGDWDFMKIEAMDFGTEALIEEFGFDKEYIEKQQTDLDNIDFGDIGDFDMDLDSEDKLIKQFVIKFEGVSIQDVEAMIKQAKVDENVDSLEDVILAKVRKYEANNS